MIKPFIGTSGWHYDDWKVKFYPDKLPKAKWLEYYCTKFNTVEINATFYRFFKDETFHNWAQQTPEDFKFVLKAPQLITHRKYLKNCEDTIKEFSRSANLLEDKLGLILLQLAPKTIYDPEVLKKALLEFKDPKKVVVEFRSEKWLNEDIFIMLKELGVVFCSIDTPALHVNEIVTSETAYFRMHGRDQMYTYDYTDNDLIEISHVIKKVIEKGAKRVYAFFNNDVNCYAPKNALRLKEILNEKHHI